jgi:hypothetical protein
MGTNCPPPPHVGACFRVECYRAAGFQRTFANVLRERFSGAVSAEHSQFVFATSNVNNPWDFFRSNIGARYYF